MSIEIDFEKYIYNQKKSVDTYSKYDFIARESGDRLLDKLDDIIFNSHNNPKNILNIGSKIGRLTGKLSNKFPDANIYELELTSEMLKKSRNNKNNKNNFIQADFEKLPFLDNSFDLIISNQALHYFDFKAVSKDVSRILNNKGLFLFSALGPDSFKELKSTFLKIDDFPHAHKFWDMHIYGDILKKLNFIDPVMDCQWVNFNYKDLNNLFLDLKLTGEQLIDSKRIKSLMGKNKFAKLYDLYPKNNNYYPVSIEFIFGHIIKYQQDQNKKANNNSVVKISVESLRSSLS